MMRFCRKRVCAICVALAQRAGVLVVVHYQHRHVAVLVMVMVSVGVVMVRGGGWTSSLPFGLASLNDNPGIKKQSSSSCKKKISSDCVCWSPAAGTVVWSESGHERN